MALNLKGLSLPSIAKKAGKGAESYPTKTYINLVIADEHDRNLVRTVLTGVGIVALVVLFGKFGIYDFYARVQEKESELSGYTQQLSVLEAQLTDYSEVQEEYNLYESARMVSDANLVPALDALDLVDDYISPVATVSSITLANNVLQLRLLGSSLGDAGSLVDTLYQQPIVKKVNVSNAASTNDNDSTSVTMSIELQVVTEDETAQDAS